MSQDARASIQTFNDRSAWEAAVGPFTILTEDFSPDDASDVGIPPDTDTSVGLFRVFYDTLNNSPNGWDLDTGESEFGGSRHLDFRIDTGGADQIVLAEFRFDEPIFAFGADFELIDTDMVLTFIGAGNDSAQLSASGFLGVVTDYSFTRISITSNATDQAAVDNVSFASPIPEAGSFAVWCGLVVAAAAGAGRRSKASAC